MLLKCRALAVAIAGCAALLAAADGRADMAIGHEAYMSGATAVLPDPTKPWNVNLGIGVGTAQEYIGAKNYETVLLPLVDIDWRGRVFASTQRGLGFTFYRAGQLRLGTRLTYDLGRDSDEAPILAGQRDVDASLEAGLFADYYTGPWRFSGDLRKGLEADGHNGILGTLSLARGARFGERASILVGANITAVDSKYAESYFGTTGATLGAFNPGAGLRDIGGFVDFVYFLNRSVYVSIDARVNALLGDPSKSPLVQEELPVFVGTTVGVRF